MGPGGETITKTKADLNSITKRNRCCFSSRVEPNRVNPCSPFLASVLRLVGVRHHQSSDALCCGVITDFIISRRAPRLRLSRKPINDRNDEKKHDQGMTMRTNFRRLDWGAHSDYTKARKRNTRLYESSTDPGMIGG